jgi:hypothetical protein
MRQFPDVAGIPVASGNLRVALDSGRYRTAVYCGLPLPLLVGQFLQPIQEPLRHGGKGLGKIINGVNRELILPQSFAPDNRHQNGQAATRNQCSVSSRRRSFPRFDGRARRVGQNIR